MEFRAGESERDIIGDFFMTAKVNVAGQWGKQGATPAISWIEWFSKIFYTHHSY